MPIPQERGGREAPGIPGDTPISKQKKLKIVTTPAKHVEEKLAGCQPEKVPNGEEPDIGKVEPMDCCGTCLSQ